MANSSQRLERRLTVLKISYSSLKSSNGKSSDIFVKTPAKKRKREPSYENRLYSSLTTLLYILKKKSKTTVTNED